MFEKLRIPEIIICDDLVDKGSAAGADDFLKNGTWSQEAVVGAIRKRFGEKQPISCQYMQIYCRELYQAAVLKFGSWKEAVAAAGVDFGIIRLRRHLTPEEVREEIIDLFESGENLAYSYMRKNYSFLLNYGVRKLGDGSWAEARRKCGIYKNFRKKRRVPEDYLEPELFPVDRRGL